MNLGALTSVRRLAAALLAATASACVSFPQAPRQIVEPAITSEGLRAIDGATLGLSVWRADDPKAVILAVHGMNDYARAFHAAALWWSQAADIAVYAFDQRGFGRSPDFSRWPGTGALKSDLRAAIRAVTAENPGLPVYLVAHSMGAAVALAAAREAPLPVAGVVLAAPGVWGGGRMALPYRVALNISAGVAPGKTLTGERAGRQSTDNIPVLRLMLADPLVIKATRLDAVLGVERVMGAGWDASDEIGGRVLLLYGEKDQIIPLPAMRKAGERLCGAVETRAYSNGWHMLFDDLQAEEVWRDVAEWIARGAANADGATGLGPASIACPGAGD